MKTYYVTFGTKYARQKHPAGEFIHPAGWVEITAKNLFHARVMAYIAFGDQWAFIYEEKDFKRELHPLGNLWSIHWDERDQFDAVALAEEEARLF